MERLDALPDLAFELVRVGSPAKAIDLLRRQPFDGIVLARELADSEDADTLRELSPDATTLPVVVLREELGSPLGDDALAQSAFATAARILLATNPDGTRSLQTLLFGAQRLDAMRRLAGDLAHDLNNVLGVISGYGELLQQRLDPGEPASYAGEILKASQRAGTLTDRLLAFSRRQLLHPRTLDLNELVEGLAETLAGLTGDGIRLTLRLGKELPAIRADPDPLEQMICSLAINARDAMPQGGELTIETSSDAHRPRTDNGRSAKHVTAGAGRWVTLTVRDSGTGMESEVLSHLFEPHFTTRGYGGGTGLGLATVHGIVKQSGGHICVHSAIGSGTVIAIHLPAAENKRERDCSSEPAREPLPATPARNRSTTLLVVEDEPPLRSLVRGGLEARGYSVLDAADGAAALDACERLHKPVDLLLCDVTLPDTRGPELAARLQTLYPRMKVLYMSGDVDRAVVRQDLREGRAAFLQKPFTLQELVQQVRAMLDRSGVPDP
ncbi:MAG TPA: response regulator [Thermoanaerobaculia bacterium]|nr:response regulator [Thermoanaerobaculia bacterium]